MTAIARGGRARFLPLLAAAAVGLVSHPLLDLMNTYGVRPWLPFDRTRYYGDAVFILDPWLWLTLGAGACLAAPRTVLAHVRWGALAAAALALIVYSGRAPIGVSIAWAGGAAVVAILRAAGVGNTRPRAAAAAGLVAAAAYVGVLFACSHTALERGVAAIAARLPSGERIVATSAHPRPAIPWRFDALVQTETAVHRAAVNLLSGVVGPTRSLATNLDDPLLSRVRDTYAHEVWRDFARHPFVARDDDGSLILGDARYQPKPVVDWCNISVAVPDP